MTLSHWALIRILERELNLPNHQLARLLHVTPATVARWRQRRACLRGTSEAAVRLLAQVRRLESENRRLQGELARLRRRRSDASTTDRAEETMSSLRRRIFHQ